MRWFHLFAVITATLMGLSALAADGNRLTYLDGSEEVVREGEAYRLDPGHFVQAIEHTEILEFSPREEHERTMRQVLKNVGAISA